LVAARIKSACEYIDPDERVRSVFDAVHLGLHLGRFGALDFLLIPLGILDALDLELEAPGLRIASVVCPSIGPADALDLLFIRVRKGVSDPG
jgi:hypothetical protein